MNAEECPAAGMIHVGTTEVKKRTLTTKQRTTTYS